MVSMGLTTPGREQAQEEAWTEGSGLLRGLELGARKTENDSGLACCSPCLRAVLVAAGVELGEEGEGQGGGLPSWKRPCLIVPD